MRLPHKPQITFPCNKAEPSRGGPAFRSKPRALADCRSLLFIAFILFPGDVAGMGVANQHLPLFPRQSFLPKPSVGLLSETAPAKGVSSRIPRAMHGGAGAAQRQRRPNQLTLVRTRSHTSREEQMLLTEVNDRCTQCAGSSVGLKQ